jgi:hypothetical protein
MLSPTPTAYAWQAIDYIITQSWSLANSKASDYDTKVVAASTFIDEKIADTALAMAPANVTTDVSVTEPNVDIPAQAAGIDTTFYDAMVTDAIDKLSNLFGAYISYYFPDDNATNVHAEAWLQKALTTGGTGIDQTLEMQLWENDRSRILRETTRQVDEATNMFASRRFPIPPGFLTGMITRIQNAALQELSKSSREIALKQADMELQNVRFAIEASQKLRQTALSTAVDYIKALASSITVAQNLAVTQADAQNGLIRAAADFYNARINAKSLLLKRDATGAEFEQEASKVNYQGDLALIEDKIKMLVAQAEAIAHMAAAAINNLHANVGGSQQNQESGSVHYNYEGNVSGDPLPRSWP